MIKRGLIRTFLHKQRHRKFLVRKILGGDRVDYVASVNVLVSIRNFSDFIPDDRLQAKLGSSVKVNKDRCTSLANSSKLCTPKASIILSERIRVRSDVWCHKRDPKRGETILKYDRICAATPSL